MPNDFPSQANHTGWLAVTDSTLAFTSLQSIMDTNILSNILSPLYSSINNTLTPMLKLQYGIQHAFLTAGDVAQAEYILISKGFVTQPGASYISVLSGIQVSFLAYFIICSS